MQVLGFVTDDYNILLLQEDNIGNGIKGDVAPGQTPIDAMIDAAKQVAGLTTVAGDWTVVCKFGDTVIFRGDTNPSAATGSLAARRWIANTNSNWNREPVAPECRWLIPMVLDPTVGYSEINRA